MAKHPSRFPQAAGIRRPILIDARFADANVTMEADVI
jgi:hypothetical protein